MQFRMEFVLALKDIIWITMETVKNAIQSAKLALQVDVIVFAFFVKTMLKYQMVLVYVMMDTIWIKIA